MNDMKAVLREKLAAISTIIEEKYTGESHTGILAGLSGLALFQLYYSRFLDRDEYADTGLAILTRCIDHINAGYTFPTYCTGIAGMGWTLEHLKAQGFIEVDTDGRLAETDAYLYTVMTEDLSRNHYDFLHGGIGYAYYFLKRYEHTTSETLKKRYKNYLSASITFLNNFAETEGNTVKWASAAKDSGEKRYNLGLAHGISSLVNYLSGLYVFEDFKGETEHMLRGSINYMLSVLSDDPDDFSLCPNWIKKDEPQPQKEKSRLAWCYGDPGVGISLWQASKAMNDPVLREKAIALLKHAARRTSPEASLVMDAGICHGSCGNAQIFNRIFRETGIGEFKEAALFWMEDTLKKALHKDGYAGYKQWRGSEKKWKPELSLLEGIAGIGLAIISFLSGNNEMMAWDECLMMS